MTSSPVAHALSRRRERKREGGREEEVGEEEGEGEREERGGVWVRERESCSFANENRAAAERISLSVRRMGDTSPLTQYISSVGERRERWSRG